MLVRDIEKAKNAKVPIALRGGASVGSERRANVVALRLLRLDIVAAFARFDRFQIQMSAPENLSLAGELRKLSELSNEIIGTLGSRQFESFRAKLDLWNLVEETQTSSELLRCLDVLRERTKASAEYYEEQAQDILSQREQTAIEIERTTTIPWTTLRGYRVRSGTEALYDGLERAYRLNFAQPAAYALIISDSKKSGPDPFTAFFLAAHRLMHRPPPPVATFHRQFRRLRSQRDDGQTL